MTLPPDVQFHEDVRLFIWRPRGVLDDAALSKVLGYLEDLEAKLQAPFNRFSDTLAADAVELNFKFIIQVSLHRRLAYAGRPPVKSAILATNATAIHYGPVACRADSRFTDQSSRIPGSRSGRAMGWCSN